MLYYTIMGQYWIFSLIEWGCHNFFILILLVTFLSTLFFNKADWKPQVPKEVTPKVEKSPPQAKVKKSNLKPKPQKKEQKPSSTENTVMPEEIPPPSLPPPIDIPANDDDDNFWDFYDKPFNKPAWKKYSNLLLISLFKEKNYWLADFIV